jgi:putative phosphoesterase
MKIAIFGDIHGNIEALKAAYEAARSEGAEKMYHLGDLGGYAPFVNEVVDFLIEHGIEGVQGNYDDAVANNREHCGCKAENPVQEKMANLSFAWTKAHVTQKTKEYLGNLPAQIKLNLDGRKIAIFHATPHKNNIYWFEERPDKFFLEMSGKLDADIFIYGHTHKPYRKDIGGKIFINAGSVGKPKDGDPRACVTVLESSAVNFAVSFLRVEYDIEKTAASITEAGLPEYFAGNLKKGE